MLQVDACAAGGRCGGAPAGNAARGRHQRAGGSSNAGQRYAFDANQACQISASVIPDPYFARSTSARRWSCDWLQVLCGVLLHSCTCQPSKQETWASEREKTRLHVSCLCHALVSIFPSHRLCGDHHSRGSKPRVIVHVRSCKHSTFTGCFQAPLAALLQAPRLSPTCCRWRTRVW